MATIKKQGNGYKITVSNGYDQYGRQKRIHTTWIPEPGMTTRQIEKEVHRQAVLFEESVKYGKSTVDGNIRLDAFFKIYMQDYARLYLKSQTAANYERHMQDILTGIGHIRLKDLRPAHIAALYRNLQETGIRKRTTAVCKIDLRAWMVANETNVSAFGREYGISRGALKKSVDRQPISTDNAKKIAAGMQMPTEKVFEIVHDMTPLDAGTINTYHRALSAVLGQAVKWGYIASNPASGADLPSISGKRAQYLDDCDARKLLLLLQDEPIKWRAAISFDLMSGLRRSELLGLRWCDVDLAEQKLFVRQTWNYVPSLGCYADTPKNRTSERPLRISKTAVNILLEYKLWQDRQRELLGDAWVDKDGRIFTQDDGRPMFPDSITKRIKKIVAENGLPNVHTHSLRHTYASLLIADRIPLVVVSHNLGHAQVSTTNNIYSHVISSAEAAADQTFDRYADILAPQSEDENKKEDQASA